MMLGSDAKEDKCRVCGGDGSTCKTKTGTMDMQDLLVGKDIKIVILRICNFVSNRLQ